MQNTSKIRANAYSFGTILDGRKFGNLGRVGFNGKENDGEVSGDGNSYDYGFRIYNPRLGKFFSVDPISNNYPMLTPYQYASNTPIQAIDVDGLEAINVNELIKADGTLSPKNAKVTVSNVETILIFTHTFNGAVSVTTFNIVGPSLSELKADNETWYGKIKAAYKYPRLVPLRSQIEKAGDVASSVQVLQGEFNSQLGFSGDEKGYLNTFRHILGSSLLTAALDENTAQIITDGHERDATGIINYTGDGMSDIINNMYGRKLGKELAGKYDFKNLDDNATAEILNTIADYTIKSFPELKGKIVKFDAKDERVKQLTTELKAAANSKTE